MPAFLGELDFNMLQWGLSLFSAFIIGASKTGLAGITLLVVPLMAGVFGGRVSAGIVLPMLVAGDLFAVWFYTRYVRWRYTLTIVFWALPGLFLGLWVGGRVSDPLFRILIAVITFASLAVMVYRDSTQGGGAPRRRWWSAALYGLLGGFSTMIGNAAGAIMAAYFLSLRLDKRGFIATQAWFFWLINLCKIPLHIFFWGTITPSTLLFNAAMLPAIGAGAWAGLIIVGRIPEKPYRRFVIVATAAVALFMLFS